MFASRAMRFILFVFIFLFFSFSDLYSLEGSPSYLKSLHDPHSSFYKTNKYKRASIYNLNKGKNALRKRRYTRAIKYLKRFLKQKTPVRDYGLFYLGKAYFKKGYYKTSIRYFKELRENYKLSPFLKNAVIYEGRAYIRRGYYSTLLRRFSRDIGAVDLGVERASYSYFIGEANRHLGRYSKALPNYFSAMEHDRKEWRKKSLYKIRTVLRKSRRVKLSYSQKIIMAINYYHIRYYSRSYSILRRLKPNKKFNYNRLYYTALSSLKLRKWKSANRAFRKILRDFRSDDTKYVKAAYHYFRSKPKSERIKAYSNVVLNYSSSKSIPLIKELITYYDNGGKFKEKALFLKHLARYNAHNSLWSYFLSDLNRGNLSYILSTYPSIVSDISNNWFRSKFYFWLGVVSGSVGNYSNAGDYFTRSYLSYSHSYYSYKSLLYIKKYYNLGKINISFSDIRGDGKDEEEDFFSTSSYEKAYNNSFIPLFYSKQSPYINRFLYFVKAGFTGYADRELGRFLKSLPFKDRGKYYRGLAYFFHNEGRFNKSIAYTNKLVSYLNGNSGKNYVPPKLREFLFPIKYARYVHKYSKHYDIDSFLLLAVIREESRFNPKARSWAGARGLMQIMPRTGRFLSRSLGLRRRGLNLYNISMNVRFGSYYLSGLIDRFDSVSYALASYNGGPGRMRRMLRKTSRSRNVNIISGEHIIELIRIRETRNYVKKVLNSYYSYLDFYNQFVPRHF